MNSFLHRRRESWDSRIRQRHSVCSLGINMGFFVLGSLMSTSGFCTRATNALSPTVKAVQGVVSVASEEAKGFLTGNIPYPSHDLLRLVKLIIKTT